MYNDYYLEQINNKLGNISNQLNEITIDNNENFSTLYSGDLLIKDSIEVVRFATSFYLYWFIILLFGLIFYKFYSHCFKGR